MGYFEESLEDNGFPVGGIANVSFDFDVLDFAGNPGEFFHQFFDGSGLNA